MIGTNLVEKISKPGKAFDAQAHASPATVPGSSHFEVDRDREATAPFSASRR
jgi:hypothetical protein